MKKPDTKGSQLHLKHTGKESHLLKEIMLTHLSMLSTIPRIAGMPAARFGLFRTIAVSPEPLGPMEIARRLGVNAAAITRQLNDMETEHLIVRTGDPKDARRSYVKLTKEGRRVFEDIHRRMHEFEALLRTTLNEAEIATAVKVLTQLRETLAEFSEKRRS
jgi:DNA-binding MarR family transcriptional regulator